MRLSPLDKRRFKRDHRDQGRAVAWVFIGSPVIVLLVGDGRYSVLEAAFMPIVGVLMLLWYRRHPTVPAHVAAVERAEPGYLPWCDCGWTGDDHREQRAARAEAREHTEHVRRGLHAYGQ